MSVNKEGLKRGRETDNIYVNDEHLYLVVSVLCYINPKGRIQGGSYIKEVFYWPQYFYFKCTTLL